MLGSDGWHGSSFRGCGSSFGDVVALLKTGKLIGDVLAHLGDVLAHLGDVLAHLGTGSLFVGRGSSAGNMLAHLGMC